MNQPGSILENENLITFLKSPQIPAHIAYSDPRVVRLSKDDAKKVEVGLLIENSKLFESFKFFAEIRTTPNDLKRMVDRLNSSQGVYHFEILPNHQLKRERIL